MPNLSVLIDSDKFSACADTVHTIAVLEFPESTGYKNQVNLLSRKEIWDVPFLNLVTTFESAKRDLLMSVPSLKRYSLTRSLFKASEPARSAKIIFET